MFPFYNQKLIVVRANHVEAKALQPLNFLSKSQYGYHCSRLHTLIRDGKEWRSGSNLFFELFLKHPIHNFYFFFKTTLVRHNCYTKNCTYVTRTTCWEWMYVCILIPSPRSRQAYPALPRVSWSSFVLFTRLCLLLFVVRALKTWDLAT